MIARENFQQGDEIVAIAKILEKVLHATSNLQSKNNNNNNNSLIINSFEFIQIHQFNLRRGQFQSHSTQFNYIKSYSFHRDESKWKNSIGSFNLIKSNSITLNRNDFDYQIVIDSFPPRDESKYFKFNVICDEESIKSFVVSPPAISNQFFGNIANARKSIKSIISHFSPNLKMIDRPTTTTTTTTNIKSNPKIKLIII